MKLKVLASGSKGNCYILDDGIDALVLECGEKFDEVKKALDFDISRINGCLCTHEHLDHARHVNDFLKSRIKVYASAGTIEAVKEKVKIDSYSLPMFQAIDKGSPIQIGAFRVIAFDIQHDCNDPLGFLIHHDKMGLMLFATDTYYLKYNFEGLNQVVIECNYSKEILFDNVKNGRIPSILLQRTLQSHMSYQTCLETLEANDLTNVNNVILIHLSDGNSNAKEFKEGVQKATGKSVYVAEKGLTINFGKTPF